MGNTGSSCKHTHTHTHTSFLTDHETWVQSKDKNMLFCAVWQLHGQKTWTTTIAWINVFVDWSYFWGAFWWNMVLWSRALKSTLPVTYQQDFSKEAAGSLMSNMAYGEAQQCILSFNVKKNNKEKKIFIFFWEYFSNDFSHFSNQTAWSFGHHNFSHKLKCCALLHNSCI